jgi:hypothetical protein
MSSSLLNNLVKSLTKNEKGYFIKSLSKADSSYGKLFKLITSQKKYDEKIIRAEFEGTYIGDNFSFAKNYLYHSILKSLIQFGAKNKDAYYYFSSVKILYQKGLYRNCAKMLKQIVKKSYEFEDYLSILRAIQYIKLLRHSNLNFDKDLVVILAEEPLILERQQIVSTFQSLLAEIKGLRIRVGGMKEAGSIERVNSIKNHPYMNNKDKIINKYCEQMYHEILFLSGFLLQDSSLTKKHITPLHRMIIDPEYSQNLNGYRKLDILRQLIRYNVLNCNYAEAQENIQALRDLLEVASDINQSEIVAGYAYVYAFQTDLWLNQKKLEETKGLFKEIDLYIEKYSEVIPKEFFVVISANILVLRFMLKDYKEVLKLVNDLLVTYKNSIRQDIVISTMLAEIVVFYELNEIELFESRINAFTRYIHNYKIKEKTLRLFSKFFIEILHGKEVQPLAKELIVKIDGLKSSRIILDLEYLIDWVRKKSSTS